jgi:hypothetical protein
MKIISKRLLFALTTLLTASGAFAFGSGHSVFNNRGTGLDTGFNLNSESRGPASGIVLHGSLVSFNASSGRHSFTLSWNTVARKGCDHFDIERSLDGLHFEKMGEVKGNEDSKGEDLYSFRDNFHPVTARKFDFYYRLREVDADGQISYSKILIARMYNTRSLASVSITPDPSVNDILVNVQLKENSYVVMKITDQDGNQIIKRSEKAEGGTNTFKLEGSNQLESGRYILEVIVNSNERLTMQLEKI